MKNYVINAYADIFDTGWDSKGLLKRATICFLSSFVGTIGIFFAVVYALGNFDMTIGNLKLLGYSDNFSAFLLFGIAFLQMTGWIFVLQLWHRASFGKWFGIKNDGMPLWKIFVYGCFLAAVLYYAPNIIVPVLDSIGIPDSEKVQTEFMVLSYPIFAMVFFPLIGMFEEVFFRGVLQNVLSRNSRFAAVGAILASSTVFTALHAFQYGLKVLIVVFCLSVILGISYATFKSLRLNMFAHYVNNLVAVIAIIITTGSLGTADVGAKTSTLNADESEFNIFVKTFAITSNENPYYIKYNTAYAFLKHCPKEDVNQLMDYVNDYSAESSFYEEMRINSDELSLAQRRALIDKKHFEIKMDKKKKIMSVCDYPSFEKTIISDLNVLKKAMDNGSSETDSNAASTLYYMYKSLADNLLIRND